MITEKEITDALKDELLPLPYVYAFWIEGSFAMNTTISIPLFTTYIKAYASRCC